MTPALDSRLKDLARLRASSPMYDAVIDEIDGRRIRVGDDWLVDYASCNYLGLDLDPEIMAAINEQVRRWGTHPSWSRLLGNPRLYPQIEDRLTELLGAPDTLLLPTVTLIHGSVLPALAGDGTVLVERQAHKTIHDAAIYARGLGATVRRFRADDPQHLVDLLRAAPPPRPDGGARLVCLDGVNSMTGNLPDLPLLAELCREHDAWLYLDDAHGFGVLGERRRDESSPYGARGNAAIRHAGESYDRVILVGGLSKAYSSLLAFVALPSQLKDYLKIAAPPYLYSGPSPTASLASALAGLHVNDARGEGLRADLYRMTARILDHVRDLGLYTPNRTGTPIIELPLDGQDDLEALSRQLWGRGIYATLAAYPLVARDQVGVRLQVTAAHTDADVDQLLAALTDLADAGLLRTRERVGAPR